MPSVLSASVAVSQNCPPSPEPSAVLDYFAMLMKVATKKAKKDQEVKHAAVLRRVLDTLKAYNDEIEANASTEGVEETAGETLNQVD